MAEKTHLLVVLVLFLIGDGAGDSLLLATVVFFEDFFSTDFLSVDGVLASDFFGPVFLAEGNTSAAQF